MEENYHRTPYDYSGSRWIFFEESVFDYPFVDNIIKALAQINPIVKLANPESNKFNDEYQFNVESDIGPFIISVEREEVFIETSEANNCIATIDSILKNDHRFKKLEAPTKKL